MKFCKSEMLDYLILFQSDLKMESLSSKSPRNIVKFERGSVPEGAIILTEEEAVQARLQLVHSWKPRSEVWPFTYGQVLISAISGAGGFYCNHYYRKCMKLRNCARMSTYIPVVVLPSLLTPILHSTLITSDILIGKTPCSLCVQIKAMALQVTIGALYPMVLAPLGCFQFAERYLTYPLPSIRDSPREVFRLYQKLTAARLPQFGVNVMIQALLAWFITHKEITCLHTITSKLERGDDDISTI
ncbi:uncharacterized protein LOC106471827 [Limulus polyphemus]|uniref:Uncharacterized protein LOC106471827 n=1 Tax=Limulus polyphemus TaxID=6850 RepID=A0ABM1BSN7_LIMPO|nr:uncharacterized protein LOC106471827 [Limulus polyphemus]